MRTLIILAGGKSTRLNQKYKPLLKLNNKYLISMVLERIYKIFEEIIIVVKNRKHELMLKPVTKDYNPIFTYDTKEFKDGPLVAMYSGARIAKGEYLFIIAVDYPFITSNICLYLLEKLSRYEAVVPIWPNGYIEPLASAYKRSSLLDKAYSALAKGYREARAPLKQLKTCYVSVYELSKNPEITFLNINYLEDLKQARDILKRISDGSS